MTKQTVHTRVSKRGKPFVAGSKVQIDLPKLEKDDLMVVANMTYFRKILHFLKSYLNEVRLKFADGKMMLQAMDPANIAMLKVSIGNHDGISVRQTKPTELAINLENLYKAVKDVKKEVVRFSLSDNKLHLTSPTMRFDMPIIVIDEKEQKYPDLKFTASVDVDGPMLLAALKRMSAASGSLVLQGSDHGVEMIAEGDLNTASEVISQEKVPMAKARYSVEYMMKLAPLLTLKDVTFNLKWSKNYPLLFTASATNLDIRFVLAPRITDDDQAAADITQEIKEDKAKNENTN